MIRLVIPGTPPSVNHYKVKTKRGHTYVTAESQAFKTMVWFHARGGDRPKWDAMHDSKSRYAIVLEIYRGAKQKGDVDNYAKLPLDALKDALVIHSDDAVDELHIYKYRDVQNPRTVITVSVIGGD